MAKRIKHVSELPQWFRLDKYDDAKKLDTTGWCEQLSIRSDFLLPNTPPPSERIKVFKPVLEAIREKPIFDVANEEQIARYCYYFHNAIFSELKTKKLKYIPGVHLMTLEELDIVRRGLTPGRLEYVAKWQDQFKEWDTSKPPIKYEPWIMEPLWRSVRQEIKEAYGHTGRDVVVVDLCLSDDILIDNFKQFLAIRRAETNRECLVKRSRQNNFSDWISFGVLPYLDLKIWEDETGMSIPYRVMADAIYPAGEGGEETVRKTTIPLANSLIQTNYLEQLVGQAAIEIAEQNSKEKIPE